MSHPPMARGVKPPCMTADDWARWQSFNRRSSGEDRASLCCRDCMPEHKAEMLRAGLCDRPKVRFTALNGALVGVMYEDGQGVS